MGYAPHEDELERLGEAKGIVTASANNSSNQPYLQIITREKIFSYVLPQNKVHDINKLTVANGSLKYELPSDSRVLLTIHNLQGKMIKTYINNVQKAGLHKVDIWNTYLAKGQYILSFKTDTFNTKKIISIYK